MDTGAVYVADGAGAEGDSGLSGNIESYNIPTAQFERCFAHFLLHFKLNGESVYKEQIRRLRAVLGVEHGGDQGASSTGGRLTGPGTPSIRLDIEHLAKWKSPESRHGLDGGEADFDTMSQAHSDTTELSGGMHWGEAMMQALRRHPLKYLPSAEGAMKQIYAALSAEEHPGAGGGQSAGGMTSIGGIGGAGIDMHSLPNIQLELISRDKPTKIRDLKAGEVESLVVLPGIVLQAGKPQHKATTLKVQCKDCKTEKFVKIPPWRQSVALPRTCDANRQGEEKCSLDPFVVLSDESHYTDVQSIKMQELPEDVPTGDMPRHLMLNCASALSGRVIAGERIVAVGVFSSFERSSDGRGGERVRAPYVHVLGLDYSESSGQRKKSTWGYREEEEFRQMAQDSQIIEKVTQSIAPAVFGCEDVKRSIACLLFGGSRKYLPDNTRVRGDINVLLLGDPSTAKSQFLKFVDRCAPIAVYTSGKGSSAAGLTAAIVRDASGNFALEGGAMVLADGGVVCIDEFDKMRDDDRVAIHEAMEQQTISIAKAGITTILNTKCSVLAAANPSFGSYDDSKDTTEQHDFETTILSRFDMIWIIRDDRSVDRDKTIARHVFALHAGATDANTFEGPYTTERLRQYVAYCRATCDPRLTESSAKKLENYYVEVREACRSDTRRKRDQIPITVRQLESLARLSESLAKMSLSQDVEETHVDEAIRLFRLATIEASKSSLARENLTSAERELIKAAEDAILQRLPLHARASKATVVRDLRMRGYDGGHVSRAVRILIQKGVLEERGDASVRRLPAGGS